MSDEDMIRRGDALEAFMGYDRIGNIKDAIAAIPAVQVGVKPLDISYVQKHAFLAGVVAARNVPPSQPCNGPLLWLDYDPGDNPALSRIRSALTAQPSPDVAALVEALEALIQQTYDCEKELTEVLHHIDFCGESEPLAKARAALARVKGGDA